ncbi:hypothetical protein [Runella zeae]|uniref:hypothetical protein n=1 Tax=Runella zeae TaxID=94255 RepID=UPI002356AFBA|nr:hypothetical protein [Runella zeae]
MSFIHVDHVSKDRYIEVLVPGHVRQFMMMEYAGGRDTIRATQNQLIGAIVVSACEKVPYGRVRSRKREKGSKIRIVLPTDVECSHISQKTLIDLAVIFEKLFFEKLRSFVTCGFYVHTSERNTVDLFLQLYDINPDDWDLDAAYACWKRYKSELVITDRKNVPDRFSKKMQK